MVEEGEGWLLPRRPCFYVEGKKNLFNLENGEMKQLLRRV